MWVSTVCWLLEGFGFLRGFHLVRSLYGKCLVGWSRVFVLGGLFFIR